MIIAVPELTWSEWLHRTQSNFFVMLVPYDRTSRSPAHWHTNGATTTASMISGDVRFRVQVRFASTAEIVKSFGRRQAYESLACRNPRAACCELWRFVLPGVPAPVANAHMSCCGRVEEVASGLGRGACRGDTDRLRLPDGRRHIEAHTSSR